MVVREQSRPTIPMSRLAEFVQQLVGDTVSINDIRSIHVDSGGVVVEAYAKREDGSFFQVGEEIAVDRIVIPGEW